MRTAVVFKTHLFNEEISARYNKLQRECPFDFDVFMALHCEDRTNIPRQLCPGVRDGSVYLWDAESLLRLPYPEKCRREGWTLNPGNTDLILLKFIKDNPYYDYFWDIEHDVHYEGTWSTLMERFRSSGADLLATTIYAHAETPTRNLRRPFKSPAQQHFRKESWIKAFLPLSRLSARGAGEIERAYRDGCTGHYEITWPTILHANGLKLEDIGGNGPWVRPENRDRFYFNTRSTVSLSPGTFVFRPSFQRVTPRKNTLWHPVKAAGAYDWFQQPKKGPLGRLIASGKRIISYLAIKCWLLFRWRPLGE